MSTKLLVINPHSGLIQRFVNRACVRAVMIDKPDEMAAHSWWLDNFRQTGYVEDTQPKGVA